MWDVGLASMFKERDNKSSIGACIGRVVGVDPFQVNILDGDITLQAEQLYICESLLDTYTRKYKQEGNIQFTDTNTSYKADGTAIFTDTLKIGDEVMVVPTEREQIFFIVNKVQKVGA